MSEATTNDSKTPAVAEVCTISTSEKVTKEYILPNWLSDHEQLIDFAFVKMKLGDFYGKDCTARLTFGRYTSWSDGSTTQYVSLRGSIENMRTSFWVGMKVTIVSKSGTEYLKDHFVCFKDSLDRCGKLITNDLFPHKQNGSLVIKEKDIHLIITIEPSSFRNVTQAASKTLETELKMPENPEFPVVVENLANMSLQQQPPWAEKVRKFLTEIEEKKKESEFQKNSADQGVPESIIKLLEQSLQNSLDGDVELELSQSCTTDNMFQLYNVAKRCGFEKATENITKYIKSNI